MSFAKKQILKHPIVFLIIRFIGYSIFIASLPNLIFTDFDRITEESLTEYLQVMFLSLNIVIYYLAARLDPPQTGLILGICCFWLICIIRELDFFFDQYDPIFIATWPILIFLVILIFIYLIYQKRDGLSEALADFISSQPGFGINMAGFLTIFIFSRFIASKHFWNVLIEMGTPAFIRRFIEESFELLGYGLFLIAALEYLISRFQKNWNHHKET